MHFTLLFPNLPDEIKGDGASHSPASPFQPGTAQPTVWQFSWRSLHRLLRHVIQSAFRSPANGHHLRRGLAVPRAAVPGAEESLRAAQ